MSMTIATQLAPFIAWLAGRDPDPELRRRYRQHVQSYLEFAAQHGGPSEQVRQRWEAGLSPADPAWHERCAALARFAEHRQIIERTRIPTA
jgi:hypothetical protein